MAGETPDRPALTADEETERLRLARKIELVKLAVGAPALLLSLFATLLAFRVSNRSFDATFWFTLAGILAVFAAYFGRVALTLRRLNRAAA